MIVIRKQIFLRHLEALMRGGACWAKVDIDRIFAALTGITDPDEVIAKRMPAEIEHRQQLAAAADFAALDLR
jgi:hypothetical protein